MLNSYFIIEKDKNTINNIQSVFDEYPEFTHMGTTSNYDIGMNSILKQTPEIVFINVDSETTDNSEDIFLYCNQVDNYITKKPLYIALSKDENKAYKAFKYRFFDYILKPGSELDIRKTVLQLVKKQKPFLNNTICLKSYKDYTLLDIRDIAYLQADNNSTDFILLNGTKVTAFKTLKSFESVLPNNFLRIHHSYIVNKHHISRINFGKLTCFLFQNKITLPFSKSYRHNLHSLENLLSRKAISFN